MMHADDISATAGDDFGHLLQLSRLIEKLNAQIARASRREKASFDDTRQNRHVDVAARNHAYHFFAGKVRNLDRRHGYRARALGNHFLLFDECQNRRRNFILFHGHDLIDICFADFKRIFARLFDGDTVGNGGNLFQTFDFSVAK